MSVIKIKADEMTEWMYLTYIHLMEFYTQKDAEEIMGNIMDVYEKENN